MAWLDTDTDKTADAASAKVLVSQSETTDFLYQHPTYPLKTTVTTEVTLYRGLTEKAATTLVTALAKADDIKVVFYYGSADVDGEVVVALSGTKTDAQAQRADETGQWQVTATKTTYAPSAGSGWNTSNADSVTTSETVSASCSFCGIAYTPKYHIDFYNHKTVIGTTAQIVEQYEVTTVTTVRQSNKPNITFGPDDVRPEGQATFGDKDYGQVSKRVGTRVTVSATKLPQGRGWSVTTTTTVFS